MTLGIGDSRSNTDSWSAGKSGSSSTEAGFGTDTDARTDRSISAVAGIVLLFGMVAIGAAVLAVSGMALVDSLEAESTHQQGLNELSQLDHTLATQGYDPDDVRSFALSGEYEMVQDGTLTITAKGQFGSEEPVVPDLPLQTVRLDAPGEGTVGYQGGGIFVGDDESSYVHKDPSLRYGSENASGVESKRLSFSVVDLQGNLSQGENRVEQQARNRSRETLQNITYVTGVEIRIENSTYHHAWASFLSEEFGSSAVSHFTGNQTVVVDADIDHDRPFSQYIEVYPDIYGGLHVESTRNVALESNTLSVDNYDSRNGTYDASNASPDLFTIDVPHDKRVNLRPSADIDGLPVSNGSIRFGQGPSVTPFAFYGNANESAQHNPDVLTAKLTRNGFDSIDSIDTEVANAIGLLDGTADPLPINGPIDEGLYVSSSNVDLSNDPIETGSGSAVHIGVTGDLTMEDVAVTGSGQTHIYVTGDVELSNVTIPNQTASSLWIYGTSNADIEIDETFQGVVYAPGSTSLELDDGTEIYGSVVAGEPDIGDDVDVHFDRALRSAEALADDDLNQSWSASEPNDLDVSFVLDATGSMEWNDEYDQIEPATKNAIDMLSPGYHRAGVFEFNTEGRTRHEISHDLDSVKETVRAEEEGGTNISTGMKVALDNHAAVDDGGEKHMILLTDGANDVPCYWNCEEANEHANETTIAQASRAAADDVTIWTIAFDAADAGMMQNISNTTGGEYYEIHGADEIEAVMEQILNEVIEEEESLELAVNLDFEAKPRPNHHAFDVQTFQFTLDS
ncbi:vWA domain-containing protein [Halovivax cerinus]|uniref:VWA domain-containing protein n=1 Tax=Halovivax cerinus TaxID=1487865 RepID=A0ABD5NNI9_9EURY|nr:vWA domain-containing protein [Halovivax cerinus]